MKPAEGHSASAAIAWRRAARARERAARAQETADQYVRRAADTGKAFYEQMAASYQKMAECHLSSAGLQESYARRTGLWTPGEGGPPRFMTGVAEACGTRSASLALLGSDRDELCVAASDAAARAAQDLEYTLGEGPVRDAAAGLLTVTAAGPELAERWPVYGPALGALGFSRVVSVPLSTEGACLGALAVFDPRPGLAESGVFGEIADALTRTVLLGPDAEPDLYGGAEHRDVVHQATGVLMERLGIPAADGLALLKARAFASGEPIEQLAREIAGDARTDD
ncbi:ANTAR domain-containing protein [Streptomyces sp. NPDC001941]|uniref:ANTAR domain-containing protein n=1 Tax=Streptomyces sp. NPDC001941 TaxID=3154659 RepID=UPI0033255306